ncbi:nicotinate phosphoribosyltransferase [Amycolatopsis thermoflava]
MSGLETDLYEIRMAVSYLRRGMTAPATFSLFPRRLPGGRGFLVAAGLADALDFLTGFGFTGPELDWLRAEAGLRGSDLDALAGLRFNGEVRAVPEGRLVAAGTPLLEVTAPFPQAQLVETALLNFLTHHTAVATKAARCRLAAGGAGLIDFAARRTHGLEAARAAARATAIAGFSGTSYVAGARELGIPALGTMAHSYVQAIGSDAAAFRAFAEDFPSAAVFLVDTFDTVAGVRHAIEVARELGLPPERVGVRLDSGDLGTLAREARQLLDDAGFTAACIVASGGLDEYAIEELVRAGAPVDVYGVGTKVGVSADAPSLDTAYKLVSYAGRPVLKLSTGKATLPGAKQVYRGAPGEPDLLALRSERPPSRREPLLVPVMTGGQHVGESTVAGARRWFERDLERLPARARRLRDPAPLELVTSPALRSLAGRLGGDAAAGGRSARRREREDAPGKSTLDLFG